MVVELAVEAIEFVRFEVAWHDLALKARLVEDDELAGERVPGGDVGVAHHHVGELLRELSIAAAGAVHQISISRGERLERRGVARHGALVVLEVGRFPKNGADRDEGRAQRGRVVAEALARGLARLGQLEAEEGRVLGRHAGGPALDAEAGRIEPRFERPELRCSGGAGVLAGAAQQIRVVLAERLEVRGVAGRGARGGGGEVVEAGGF